MTPCISFSQRTWEGDIPVRPLKVAVIREEFVALTGGPLVAVVLNQLLYWTQRVKDLDLFLEEERILKPRAQNSGFVSAKARNPKNKDTLVSGSNEDQKLSQECKNFPCHGWIYKTTYDLIEETMLGISHPTMRKYLKRLVDQGWINERTHPFDKWNKTTQYRVNIRKLQKDLLAIGHHLPDIYLETFSSSLLEDPCPNKVLGASLSIKETSNVKNLHSNENETVPSLNPSLSDEEISIVRNLQSSAENFDSSVKSLPSDVRNFPSDVKNLPSYTYTEITPETKNREHTQYARDPRWDTRTRFFDEAIVLWKKHVSQEITLTEERKHHLKSLLAHHFQDDLSQWERFCERIKTSPFLMGEGARKWRVSFDWILSKENVLKVLEGNYDAPEAIEQKNEETRKTTREKEKEAILESIKNPTWKAWCVELNESNPISLFELKELSQAKFMEFDGKLVWIKSADQKTLNRIESVRLKLLSIVQRKFPNARNIRIQTEEEGNEEAFSSDFSEKPTINLRAMPHKTTKNTLPAFLKSSPLPDFDESHGEKNKTAQEDEDESFSVESSQEGDPSESGDSPDLSSPIGSIQR